MEKEIVDLKKDFKGYEKLKNFIKEIKKSNKPKITLNSSISYNFNVDLIEKKLVDLDIARNEILKMIDSERPIKKYYISIQAVVKEILGLNHFNTEQLNALKEKYDLETNSIKEYENKFILIEDVEGKEQKINLKLIRKLVKINKDIHLIENIKQKVQTKEEYKENTYLNINPLYKNLDSNYYDMAILSVLLVTNKFTGCDSVQNRVIKYLNFMQHKYQLISVDYVINSNSLQHRFYVPKKYLNEILEYFDKEDSILNTTYLAVNNYKVKNKNLKIGSRVLLLDNNLDIMMDKAYFITE